MHQPGLADAAGPEHCDQTRVGGVEPIGQLPQLGLATNENVALGRQVVPHLARREPEVADLHDTAGLLAVRRGRKLRRVAYAQLEDLDRLLDPLESVVAVPRDLCAFVGRISERNPGGGAHQRLAAAGERHDAGRKRLGEAFHLDRLGPSSDVVRRVLPQGHGASMDANPGAQREICEFLVVREREADSIGRLIEQ